MEHQRRRRFLVRSVVAALMVIAGLGTSTALAAGTRHVAPAHISETARASPRSTGSIWPARWRGIAPGGTISLRDASAGRGVRALPASNEARDDRGHRRSHRFQSQRAKGHDRRWRTVALRGRPTAAGHDPDYEDLVPWAACWLRDRQAVADPARARRQPGDECRTAVCSPLRQLRFVYVTITVLLADLVPFDPGQVAAKSPEVGQALTVSFRALGCQAPRTCRSWSASSRGTARCSAARGDGVWWAT